jgi:uncharacterized protein (TIGR02145 family)
MMINSHLFIVLYFLLTALSITSCSEQLEAGPTTEIPIYGETDSIQVVLKLGDSLKVAEKITLVEMMANGFEFFSFELEENQTEMLVVAPQVNRFMVRVESPGGVLGHSPIFAPVDSVKRIVLTQKEYFQHEVKFTGDLPTEVYNSNSELAVQIDSNTWLIDISKSDTAFFAVGKDSLNVKSLYESDSSFTVKEIKEKLSSQELSSTKLLSSQALGLSVETVLSQEVMSSSELGSSSAGISSVQNMSSIQMYMIDEREEKNYKIVTIGTQTWMAENLNYGEYLKDLDSDTQYQDSQDKFCYDNIESNCETSGGLYQWHVAMALGQECSLGTTSCSSQVSSVNHQGICPIGWHIPSDADWTLLGGFLGGKQIAAKSLKAIEEGNAKWNLPIYNDSNSTGFAGIPTGHKHILGGFAFKGERAYYWDTEESQPNEVWYRRLYDGSSELYRGYAIKRTAFSVRCLKN